MFVVHRVVSRRTLRSPTDHIMVSPLTSGVSSVHPLSHELLLVCTLDYKSKSKFVHIPLCPVITNKSLGGATVVINFCGT